MGIRQILLSTTLLLPFLPLLCQIKLGGFALYTLHEYNSLPLIIWYSGVVLAVLSFWGLGQRTSTSVAQVVPYICFIPLVYLFISTTNLLVFFMCYEFFLLPSFFIVFLGSPNRRGVLASIYFLMWTQVGSFLVFIGVVWVFTVNNTFHFGSNLVLSLTPSLFALVGFGIKIPMWPAHYWLTKTHVEAPTYFSIYLSGFLVKTALYGIWIFSTLSPVFNHTAVLLVAVIGVTDASLKMWAQVDLKKLVAYGTVQEMNLILIGFVLATSTVVKAASLFILAHTVLSTIFFLMSDSIYRRWNSRSTSSVRGLLQTTPLLGYTLFVCCLFFAGLPFTLKFVVEVYIFTQLFNISAGVTLVALFVCNWFGLISFMKNWFVPLFGGARQVLVPDLSIREAWVYSTLCTLLILVSFISVYVI